MKVGIYKEVQIDTSHRLLYYKGKCANLHGHRWKVEVWMEGEPNPATQILIDYSLIKQVIDKYDHQIILNRDDPMVPCIQKFNPIIKLDINRSSYIDFLASLYESVFQWFLV